MNKQATIALLSLSLLGGWSVSVVHAFCSSSSSSSLQQQQQQQQTCLLSSLSTRISAFPPSSSSSSSSSRCSKNGIIRIQESQLRRQHQRSTTRYQILLLEKEDDDNDNIPSSSPSAEADDDNDNEDNQEEDSALLPPPVASSSPIVPTNNITAIAITESTSVEKEGKQESDTTTTAPTTAVITEEGVSATLPSFKKLLLFTGTTILIWISEPLLSLVDTTVVGLTQSKYGKNNAVLQVAALGPATTLIDSLQYLTYFLAMATTSQIAKFIALKDYKKLQQTTSQILGVAACLGIGISLLLFIFGLPILSSMIGGSSSSPELLKLASRYCWIRATVAPLAVMGMVAESSCLANLDTKTPAIAVATASIVNIVGDLLLSFMGIQGAAIATAIATTTSTTIMLRKVTKRTKIWRKRELLGKDSAETGLPLDWDNEKVNGSSDISTISSVNNIPTLVNGESSSKNNNKKKEGASTKDNDNNNKVISKENKEIPFLSLPDKSSMIDLVKISGPMFFVMLGKIACYGAMSVRATDFGVVNLAAHSIMMRVFFFFTCFGDSLSQATQSFLPTFLYPKPDNKNLRKMLKRLLIFSSCVGIFISTSSNWILSNFGSYLTNDKAVIGAIVKHTKFVALSLFVHPFIMLTEGTMIATRDFRHIMSSYLITIALHFGLLSLACKSFQDIWLVLFLFQTIRVSLFGARVIRKVVTMGQKQTS